MALRAAGLPDIDNTNLLNAVKQLNQCMAGLISCMELPIIEGAQDAEKFSVAGTKITESANALMVSAGKPENIKKHIGIIDEQSEAMRHAALHLIDDPDAQRRLRELAERLGQSVSNLLSVAPDAINKPNDNAANAKLRGGKNHLELSKINYVMLAAQNILTATETLARDGGPKIVTAALYSSAKVAAAQTASLIIATQPVTGKTTDPKLEMDLAACAQITTEALNALMLSLRDIPILGTDNAEAITQSILGSTDNFTPHAFKLVAVAKQAVPKINEIQVKKAIGIEADNAHQAIQALIAQKKTAKASFGEADLISASEQYEAATADIDAAILSSQAGLFDRPRESRDDALQGVVGSMHSIQVSANLVRDTARETPEDIGSHLKALAICCGDLVSCGKSLASTLDDGQLQKSVLLGVKGVNKSVGSVIHSAKGNYNGNFFNVNEKRCCFQSS